MASIQLPREIELTRETKCLIKKIIGALIKSDENERKNNNEWYILDVKLTFSWNSTENIPSLSLSLLYIFQRNMNYKQSLFHTKSLNSEL